MIKKVVYLLIAIILNVYTTSKCFASDTTTGYVADTYFRTNYQTKPVAGKAINFLESFEIKGVWSDPKKLAKKIMYETLYCSISNNSCISSITSISFNTSSFYIEIDSRYYEIIDKKGFVYKLYCPETEYIIETNIKNQQATKYKIFKNGDINKYILLLNTNYISKYIETLL